jgi:hypothetical protein
VIGEVRIIDGEWVALTDWYEPHQRPHRVGLYEARIFDGGWDYFWFVQFDGRHWRDKYGMCLLDQNITWRGLTECVE